MDKSWWTTVDPSTLIILYFITSVCFGAASYFRKLSAKKIVGKLFVFATEMFFSILTGWMAFMFFYSKVSPDNLWFIIAIASYSGIKSIDVVEVIFRTGIAKFGETSLEDIRKQQEFDNKEDKVEDKKE